jgi:hypothetical protein
MDLSSRLNQAFPYEFALLVCHPRLDTEILIEVSEFGRKGMSS